MTALSLGTRAATTAARRSRRGEPVRWAAALALLAAVIAAVLFHLAGGTWFVVETPSMGTAAPVGTLLIDEPAAMADLRVGDVITFRPPTAPNEVYSHRVVAATGDGVRTRGDINGAPDGWVVHQRDLIGRAVVMLPVVGWLVRAVPIVVAGCLLTALLTRWPAGVKRRVTRLLGGSLSIALAAAWLHPFAGVVLLQTAMVRGTAVATLVGTGLLPVRATSAGASAVTLVPGEVGVLRVPHVPSGHRVQIASSLALDWWGWVAVAAVCSLPLVVSVALLLRGRPRRAA